MDFYASFENQTIQLMAKHIEQINTCNEHDQFIQSWKQDVSRDWEAASTPEQKKLVIKKIKRLNKSVKILFASREMISKQREELFRLQKGLDEMKQPCQQENLI